MRGTARRAGSARLRVLEAEAVAAADVKKAKGLAHYFGGPPAKPARETAIIDAPSRR